MPRQEINLGTAPTGAGGDTTRSTGVKVNAMTQEIYTVLGAPSGPITPATARAGLELGSSALAAVGFEYGNVAPAYSTGRTQGSVIQSWFNNSEHGVDPNLYQPGSPNMPSGGTGYWYKQIFRHANSTNRLTIAWPYGITGNSGTVKFQSIYDGAVTPWIELYHTGNTTRAADGTLKAI